MSECSPCPRAAETRLSAGRCCSHRCKQATCTYARQRQARTSLPSSVPPLQIRHSAVSLLSVLVMTSVEPSAAWAASADSVWGSAWPRPVSFFEFCIQKLICMEGRAGHAKARDTYLAVAMRPCAAGSHAMVAQKLRRDGVTTFLRSAKQGDGGRGQRKTGRLSSSAALVRVRASQREKDLARVDVRPRHCAGTGGGLGNGTKSRIVFFFWELERVCGERGLSRPTGTSERGTMGSSHCHSLAYSICVCIARSPAPEGTFCSRWRLVVARVADGASCTSPYLGFRYTPAGMRARCSGHRYLTESSALAMNSLSVDSPQHWVVRHEVCACECVRVQDFRRF